MASASGSSPAASLADFAARAYPTLNGKSYYQLLNLTPGADAAAVRKAFYTIAGHLHPDRFAGLPDAETRAKLESIYARVCEAYRVLQSPEKRASYDKGLAAGKLRFDFTAPAEAGHAAKNPEDSVTHADAKRFFRLGMVCLSAKDYKGAVMNFGFARSYQPDAALILAKLAEAQALQAGSGKGPAR